jgi:hypothetical protein
VNLDSNLDVCRLGSLFDWSSLHDKNGIFIWQSDSGLYFGSSMSNDLHVSESFQEAIFPD